MTNSKDPIRQMAEQLWKWAEVPSSDMSKEAWITQIAKAIRNHTAYPDVLGALDEARYALFGDKRQRADNALEKARGL